MAETDNTILHEDRIARCAKALGHPTRVAIMHFLASHEHTYFYNINEKIPGAKATLSQHLKELKSAGLIEGELEPPKVRYRINMEVWEEMRRLFAEFFEMCGCRRDECRCHDGQTSENVAACHCK